MNAGPTGEASSPEFQRQPNAASPDGASQNAAAPDARSQAAPGEQNSPGAIMHINTGDLVADEQSEPTALVLPPPGQAEIERQQHPTPAGAENFPTDPRLGRSTRRLGINGRGLILDRATQIRAHQLSLEYDVLPVVPVCAYCHTL